MRIQSRVERLERRAGEGGGVKFAVIVPPMMMAASNGCVQPQGGCAKV